MLLTIEKVIILKSVDIFAEVQEQHLVEVASILEEVEVKAGDEIIREGDIGTSMYIIVEGTVRVHHGERNLAEMGDRQVFGELAALAPEPRTASISAVKDTHLFRLEGGPLYELMSEHIEIARGVIRVLCERVRTVKGIQKKQHAEEDAGAKG